MWPFSATIKNQIFTSIVLTKRILCSIYTDVYTVQCSHVHIQSKGPSKGVCPMKLTAATHFSILFKNIYLGGWVEELLTCNSHLCWGQPWASGWRRSPRSPAGGPSVWPPGPASRAPACQQIQLAIKQDAESCWWNLILRAQSLSKWLGDVIFGPESLEWMVQGPYSVEKTDHKVLIPCMHGNYPTSTKLTLSGAPFSTTDGQLFSFVTV